MSNTLRKIYKQNCEHGYPSAPENQTNLSENTPDSPVKSKLYAELNSSQEAHSLVIVPTTGNAVVSQKKIRHRRLGSADSNYSFNFTPKQIDRRDVKMVHMETQTDAQKDTIDNYNMIEHSSNFKMVKISPKSSLTSTEFKNESSCEEEEVRYEAKQASYMSEESYANNGNIISTSNTHIDDTDRIYDYMNSNEQLDIVDIRENSDEDNVEKLDRRVSHFFNQNGLLQTTDNGNGSVVENRLLFNIMAARRSCISITDKEVMVLSHGSDAISAHTNSGFSRVPPTLCYKISDYNCNNDDGDDSWTDEDGEESDRNFSLRRKR